MQFNKRLFLILYVRHMILENQTPLEFQLTIWDIYSGKQTWQAIKTPMDATRSEFNASSSSLSLSFHTVNFIVLVAFQKSDLVLIISGQKAVNSPSFIFKEFIRKRYRLLKNYTNPKLKMIRGLLIRLYDL